jgi:hypothetical protein
MCRLPVILAGLALAVAVSAQPAEPLTLDSALPDCGIQKFIDQAAQAGGGTVRLPEGVFALRRGVVLRNNVELIGAGMDKTVLTPAREVLRLDVVKDSPDPEGVIHLAALPADLDVGSALISVPAWPPAWYGVPRPGWVKSVDREKKTLVAEWPYGPCKMPPGKGFLIYGDSVAPERSIAKGDTEVLVKNAALLKPGDQICFNEPPNEAMEAVGFVKEVRGNAIVLESPAVRAFAAWPDAKTIGNSKHNALHWVVFPLVQGMNVKNAAVRDLTIRGNMKGVYTVQNRYTLSGVHTFNTVECVFERIAVRDWPADGVSLQTGDKCRVLACEATGCLGNGFHPGTGLTNTLIEGCLGRDNGSGLYFCWHNRGHVLRKNRFVSNRGGGITGLGNPGDRGNLIEENLIERNGGAGIEINGGLVANNILRKNVIRDNSAAAPGKHPGIALYASAEDAKAYTIEGNTIESAAEPPTQWIGIEEKTFKRGEKWTVCDGNVIRGNKVTGHKTADILLVGPKTVCEENGDAKVVKNFAKEAAPAAK